MLIAVSETHGMMTVLEANLKGLNVRGVLGLVV
jgi:hypothetical protein